MKQTRGLEMFYVCCFLTLAFLAAAFFFYQNDSKKADEEIAEKKSVLKKIETAVGDLNEYRKSDLAELRDTVEVQKELATKVMQIEKSQGDLLKRISTTEEHLDTRISKLSAIEKKDDVIHKVKLIGPITIERVNAPPIVGRKNLGKSFGDVQQEQQK